MDNHGMSDDDLLARVRELEAAATNQAKVNDSLIADYQEIFGAAMSLRASVEGLARIVGELGDRVDRLGSD